MKKIKFSVLAFSCFSFFNVFCTELNLVRIDGGLIRGEDSIMGYEYRGIPYAEPPVGLLRFANPKPYNQSWDGVRDYVKFGASCAQYSHFGYSYLGEEDCLTLNVYVPRAVREGSVKTPVIFFIHSGSFMYGGSNVYGPENFLNNQNMILVTLNYRVGVLGFLSTEDQSLPGNFGLKDQVEALKWVQRNIEAFNGDPKQVTLAGLSAGGASVHLHYMSPLTEGLFNNGISHSGCALNPWVMQERAKEKAYDLGSSMECEFTDHVSLVKCLRTKPAEDLVMFAKRYQTFMYNPFSPFSAVIEAPSETAFITESPLSYLESGKFKTIPWLLSQTHDEGLYPAAEFAETQKLNVVNDRWLELAPSILDFDGAIADDETKMRWSIEIKNKYFDSNLISLETFGGFRQVMIMNS